MRRFILRRYEDPGGVSGTGDVAEGVEFSCGRCVLHWRTHINSIAIYDTIFQLEDLHGHDGKTKVIWVDHQRHDVRQDGLSGQWP